MSCVKKNISSLGFQESRGEKGSVLFVRRGYSGAAEFRHGYSGSFETLLRLFQAAEGRFVPSRDRMINGETAASSGAKVSLGKFVGLK